MAKKQNSWRNSAVKEMLRDDILAGKTEDKTAKAVRNMRPEYWEMEEKMFEQRFYRLRLDLLKEKKRSDRDYAAFKSDLLIYQQLMPSSTKPHWNTHPAKTLLDEDIDAGRTTFDAEWKPKDLWATRPEYLEFELTVFRKHVHQALKSRANAKVWNRRHGV
jgi:hypothetical protein